MLMLMMFLLRYVAKKTMYSFWSDCWY